MERDREGAPAVTRTVRIVVFSALAVLGAAFLLYGVLSGQVASVLTKATNVCMECIGIG